MENGLGASLPPDLEEIAIARFDMLLKQGKIFYEPPKTDIVTIDDFQVLHM